MVTTLSEEDYIYKSKTHIVGYFKYCVLIPSQDINFYTDRFGNSFIDLDFIKLTFAECDEIGKTTGRLMDLIAMEANEIYCVSHIRRCTNEIS